MTEVTLGVGTYTVSADATVERRVPTHDGRVIWDRVNLTFTKAGVAQFDVVPNSAGQFRLRAGGKSPKLSLVVAP